MLQAAAHFVLVDAVENAAGQGAELGSGIFRFQQAFHSQNLARAHAPGFELLVAITNADRHHPGANHQQVIRAVADAEDHLVGQVFHGGHALAEVVFLLVAERTEDPHILEQGALTVPHLAWLGIAVPHHAGRFQVAVGEVEHMVAHLGLLAHGADKAAGLVLHRLQARTLDRRFRGRGDQ
ncbi:hypothetical protein D3C79_630640 [compost metagenome]